MRFAKLASVIFFGLLAIPPTALAENARVWQDNLEIPTYLLGAEDPNPPFPLAERSPHLPLYSAR